MYKPRHAAAKERKMKKILAVLTDEIKYAERLCSYCNGKRSLMFTAVPFDSIKSCSDFSRRHNIELLLADGKFIRGDGSYNGAGAGVADIRAAKVISLDAEYDFGRAFADSERSAVVSVNKYQPADMLLKDVMQNCDDIGLFTVGNSLPRQVRVIGVYSPAGRCGKSSFAMTLCRALSRKHKTLYLCLEEFSCFGSMNTGEHVRGMSDAMYHMKQGTLNSQKLYSVIQSYCGIEYIPPVSNAEDADTVTGEDYVRLIDCILRNSLYDAVVVDMNRFAGEASEISEICDIVYMPVPSDIAGRAKADAFTEYLKEHDGRGLADKIRKISVPKSDMNIESPNYIDSLLYGSMGDMIRELGEG